MSQADGRELSIGSATNLFTLTNTTYGGNGFSTFAIPNIAGRAIVGVGELAGASDFLLDEENIGEHGFEVLPEPSTGAMAGLATLCAMLARTRRRPPAGVTRG